MADYTSDELDPGIRKVVEMLNKAGFVTTDSGDGKTKIEAGWPEDEVLDVPHVFIESNPGYLCRDAQKLVMVLEDWGVKLSPVGQGDVHIQANYDPVDRSASIQLYGLNDEMLLAVLKEPA